LMSTLFLSDLHLDPDRPAITALLLAFLAGEARGADALHVLGDLFEAWVGDDDDGELAAIVGDAFRALHDAGVPITFIRGNRDFLLGQDYADRAGMTLRPDPCVIPLYGEPTLILHGDLLCSDDHAYLAFRRQVRDPAWQATFLAQPLAQRRAFAQKARAASQATQQQQSLEIGDATGGAVSEMFARFGIRRMIHGHTHRPRIHAHRVGERDCERIVLGDWYEQGSVLRVERDGVATLSRLPVDA
jgi:UDP-2,3-diacylglucosamine hydrolase